MNIIKKLPEDLRRYILTFTYQYQPSFLLNDIRHYLFSRTLIKELYYQENEWQYPGAGDDWFHNDLIGFCNEEHATMNGYRDYFFDIFTRMFSLKNKSRDQIIHICNNVFRDSKKTNITWGLLTIEERDTFMGSNNEYFYQEIIH